MLAAARIPARLNTVVAAALLAAAGAALFALPFVALPMGWKVAALAAVAATTPAHWALVHEAIHGVLLPGRRANVMLGRALAIAFGVPFRAARFAHLRHHRYNRSPVAREEVYDPAHESHVSAYAFHYFRIAFGLYAGELALCVLCFLPRPILRRALARLCPDLPDGSRGMMPVADRELLGTAALAEVRIDALCIAATLAFAFVAYGSDWMLPALLLCGRGFVISQLDHAPHHGTPLAPRDYALNLRAPAWAQAMLLNFNLHRTHHVHPHLPWTALRELRDDRQEDVSLAAAVLRQWRGPVRIDRLPADRN
ncbi:MAG TPA: fatty acid desaturase [Rudaea sp.]|nr:fatty acid desaturase [Rudaea sp.]